MTALEELKGVGAKTAEKLTSLGMERAEDLLFFLPKTYLDLTEFARIENLEEGDFALILIKITEKSPLIRKNGRSIAVMTGVSDGIKVKLVFYNRDYVLNQIRVGLSYRVYGKFSKIKGFHFTNPQIEEDKEHPKLTGILPVYSLKGIVPQQTFRNAVQDAILKLSVGEILAETAIKPAAETEEAIPAEAKHNIETRAETADEPKIAAFGAAGEASVQTGGNAATENEAAVEAEAKLAEFETAGEASVQTGRNVGVETEEAIEAEAKLAEFETVGEASVQTGRNVGVETEEAIEAEAKLAEFETAGEAAVQTGGNAGVKTEEAIEAEANPIEIVPKTAGEARAVANGGEIPLDQAFRFAHRPKTIAEAKVGAERILLEKTVRELLKFRNEKRLQAGKRERYYNVTEEQRQTLVKAFPFALNESQTVAIDTVIRGLRKNIPYHGMLTGDVGSGKTAVALFLAAYVALSGYQSVIMAPTELLAAQHAANAEAIFRKAGVTSALLTSSVKGKARTELLRRSKDGEIDVLIGTHSVLGKDVFLPNLAFAVVDEQHRFGVDARNALFSKTRGVDTLSMSATPIPRTLKLVYLGEHETLTLQPRHSGQNVKTRIVLKEKLDGMLCYLAEEARKGRRSFLVAPQISDMEGIPTMGAEDVLKQFRARFPDVPAALLTGKMSFAKKEQTASDFREGRVNVLVATTVVEVGLDVPDAASIAVLHADRLGLATLHQLRGRVGRAGQESYCFLYTEREEEVARLKILSKTSDGMKIAEADFRLRGAGELVGASQHGADKILAGVSEEMLWKAKAIADTKIL